MPDIAMCNGVGCPLKEECYRYKAIRTIPQQYFIVPPIVDGECEYFWPVDKIEND